MTRRLPPLNAIRAFEAASRNASFTRAAEELCVTQGAISRHVSALESWLGVKLFLRNSRGLELTPKGVAYAQVVRSALDQLDFGTRQLQQRADDRTLRLKLPPTFAIRWMVPRLAHFHALHPSIDVQITTSHEPVDFAREEVDACIHSGTTPPPGTHSRRLFGETLLPVCGKRLRGQAMCLDRPEDLAHHVLVCSMHRPRDWPTWLAAAGVPHIDGNQGIKVENSALAYQAAIDGLGVVIAQRIFVGDDLRDGRLVAPFALEVPGDGAYWLGYPVDRPRAERVAAFETWVMREAAGVTERTAG